MADDTVQKTVQRAVDRAVKKGKEAYRKASDSLRDEYRAVRSAVDTVSGRDTVRALNRITGRMGSGRR